MQHNRKQIAEQYGLALKALGLEALPISPDATDEEVTAVFTRRVLALMSMTLTDLYLVDTGLRNKPPSEILIAEFARKVPLELERQVLSSSGTPVDQLLQALLRASTAR